MFKKNKDLGKKKTSSETVSQIFQAPSEDWKPRNFGNTTLSSCSVVETSNFLLWKVGVATVFCVCVVFFFLVKSRVISFSGWLLPSDVSKWHCGFAYSSATLNSGLWVSLVAQWQKTCLPMQETWVPSPGQEDPRKREWQSTAVFLPRKSHGQRSLMDCCPWDHTDLDATEWLTVCVCVCVCVCARARAPVHMCVFVCACVHVCAQSLRHVRLCNLWTVTC